MSAASASLVHPRSIVEEAQLNPALSSLLVETFVPLFGEAVTIAKEAEGLSVTDATQVSEMKQARALRLKLRAVRVEAEKRRKTMKEESLRSGKAIDNVYKAVEMAAAPVESRLQEMEEFAERAEAARKAALKDARAALLAPYGTDTSFVDLANMPEPTFQAMLEQAKTAHEAKIAAAKKAEEERVAREKADADERARIAAENARLKAEAQAAEAAARAAAEKARQEREAVEAEAAAAQARADALLREEREAAEAKLAEERRAREALEAKARAEKEAADKKAKAEAAAAQKAAAAPDADKLCRYAEALVGLPCPEMATDAGQVAIRAFRSRVAELARSIVAEAERISK